MGKYYYVYMVNPTTFYNNASGKYERTETAKLLYDVAENNQLGYSEPNAFALMKIQECTKTREATLLGFPYEQKYVDYDPFFLICEDKNNYLEEIITKRKFEKVSEFHYDEKPSEKLRLTIVKEVPSNTVVETLRRLSEDDVSRFLSGMNKMEQLIQIGYKKDKIREEENTTQEQNNDAYIKNFRNKYGK